jgi:glycosyltransferase involved in cell wall biosynthesis
VPKIYVYPADGTGCGQFRLIKPAQALIAQGHDITIVGPSKRAGIGGAIDQDGNAVHIEAPPDADVIVLQRLTYRPIATAVPLLRARGIAVVVDMDDDLNSIHPANPAYNLYHPDRGSPWHSWQNASNACAAATLVTTSTPQLQKVYASPGRGVVLYNCVPASYLDIPRVDNATIGWGGVVGTHPDDLQTVGRAIAHLTREGHKFRIVGPPDGVREALSLDDDVEATGPLEIEAWPAALASLGIGIAPLADSTFNTSKSFLKPLEMAGLGVPWVASPRTEYRRLHDLGAGLLANTPAQWMSRLRELAKSDALRSELSEAGRTVAERHTIEGNAWKWLDAWTRAYEIERQAAAARGSARGFVRAG